MGKTLVIVESPAKAKTINKYLGNQFVVKSSVGHIRDLPVGATKAAADPKARAKLAAETRKLSPEMKAIRQSERKKKQQIERMGIDPENGWAATYQVMPGKEKVVEELKRLAANADEIVLATDLDREGEAIAWHLQEVIGGDESRFKRVVFNEITKKAIQEAFETPGELDQNQVYAQQARRFLDRVVGFMVSPLLWAKVARGLSAGRVQSVSVKVIVEREREIRAFNPEEFWDMFADLKGPQGQGRFEVVKHQGNKYRPTNGEQSAKLKAELEAQTFNVAKREDKPTSSKPSAPFITSTLQQAASTRLGFSVKKTMMLAQRLYEAGHITYMRTDSTNLSKDAVAMCRDYVGNEIGKEYLPEEPIVYGSKAGAQEAHEAVRPSDVTLQSHLMADVERDAQRLYELIWQRFVACQMLPAKYKSSTITIEAGDFELKTKGRIKVFDGFTRVYTANAAKDTDKELPDIQVKQVLELETLEPNQHFTKPPARYSEAALVKELEKQGIGRPSTYASIISTIQDRGYVKLESRRFYAEKMGDIVTDRLGENFTDLMDYQYTARMEEQLDDIAEGKLQWDNVLDEFYLGLTKQISTAEQAEGGMRTNDPVETDIACPECGRNMTIRTGTTGVFLGCSGYALPPKERCKKTLNLVPGSEAIDVDDEDAEMEDLRSKERCPICSTAMESYLIDEQRKLHVCGNNPDCDGFKVEQGTFKIKGYDGPVLDCDKCGSEMQLKNGRFGKYFGCTNEECKNTRKLLRSGQPAPPKMDPVPMPDLVCQKVEDTYILRDGAAGLFLAASKFPKNRETRAPLLKEIAPVKDQLPEKYQFLFSGPMEDENGIPTQIRFSRKEQHQYLMTDVEGKATGFKAVFIEGKWDIAPTKVPKKKAPAKKKPTAKKKTATKKAPAKKKKTTDKE